MRRAAALLLALSACSQSASNPCSGQAGVCVALEVHGPTVDTLQLTGITPARVIHGATLVPGSLPVQFAALLPAGTIGPVLFEVVGLRLNTPTALGSNTVTVPPSGQRVVIDLVQLPPGAPPPDLADRLPFDLAGHPLPVLDLSVPPGQDLAVPPPPPDLSACQRDTCQSLGATCGTPDDGCGTPLNCGPPCKLGPFSSAGFSLSPGRTAFGFVQTSSRVYLLGGQDGSTTDATASIQAAVINADGSIGAFTAAGMLTGPRELNTAAAGNGFVYVSGGDSSNTATAPLATVEKAPINADGTLGTFVSAGAAMTTARNSHVSAVIAGFLYVFGGATAAGPLASVERAPINPDGTLGAFTAAGSLTLPRSELGLLVTNNFVYIVGGSSGSGSSSIDRAPITGGGVGTFVDAGVRLTIRRDGAALYAAGTDVFAIGGAFTDVDAGNIFLPSPPVYPTSIEHATLDGAGNLSNFSIFTESSLQAGRAGHGLAVTGNSVYVLGGFDGTSVLTSIERAMRQ